ncbi:MAG: hypothetical protein ACT4PU_11560 [Planctomycetota bacterium]
MLQHPLPTTSLLLRALCASTLGVVLLAPLGGAQSLNTWNGAAAGPLVLDGSITTDLSELEIEACTASCPPFHVHFDARIRGTLSLAVGATANGPFATSPCGTPTMDFSCLTPVAATPVETNGYLITPLVFAWCDLIGEAQAGQQLTVQQEFDLSFTLDVTKTTGTTLPSLVTLRDVSTSQPVVSGGGPAALDTSLNICVLFEILRLSDNVSFGGPFLCALSTSSFEASPAAAPWWTLDASLLVLDGYMLGSIVQLNTALDEQYVADQGCGPWPTDCTADRWSRIYDLADTEELKAVVPLEGGDLFLLGLQNNSRAWMARTDAEGEILWQQQSSQLISTAQLSPRDATNAPGGELFLMGDNLTSLRVERIGGDGSNRWATHLASPASVVSKGEGLLALADGGVLLFGNVVASSTAVGLVQGTYAVAARLTTDGNVTWCHVLQHDPEFDPGNPQATFRAALELPDGDLLLVGDANYREHPDFGESALAGPNGLVARLHADGTLVYARVVGDKAPVRLNAVARDAEGRVVIAGQHLWENGTPLPQRDCAWVAGWQADTAELLWSRIYHGEVLLGSTAGDTAYDEFTGVAVVPGGFIVSGHTDLPSSVRDSWLLRISPDGLPAWLRSYRGDHQDELQGVLPMADGLLAWGWTRSIGGGVIIPEADGWIVRTGVDGNVNMDPAYGFEVHDDSYFAQLRVEANLPLPLTMIALAQTPTAGTQAPQASTITSTVISN